VAGQFYYSGTIKVLIENSVFAGEPPAMQRPARGELRTARRLTVRWAASPQTRDAICLT